MGVSLALVFHCASALALILLSAWGLRRQRELKFLRALIALGINPALPGGRRTADVPARFVLRAARAFGVPVAGKPNRTWFSYNDAVVAIEPAPIAQIFLRAQVYLIQFKQPRTIEFHLATSSPVQASELEASFSGKIRVNLIEPGDPHAP